MSRRAMTLTLLSVAAALLLLAALVHAHSSLSKKRREVSGTKTVSGNPANVQDVTNARNLALQPEALRLLRRVGGQRFKLKTAPVVIINGVLAIGPDRQDIQISRYQNASGERVELVLASGTKLLSWEASVGARISVGTLGLTDIKVSPFLTQKLSPGSTRGYMASDDLG